MTKVDEFFADLENLLRKHAGPNFIVVCTRVEEPTDPAEDRSAKIILSMIDKTQKSGI